MRPRHCDYPEQSHHTKVQDVNQIALSRPLHIGHLGGATALTLEGIILYNSV